MSKVSPGATECPSPQVAPPYPWIVLALAVILMFVSNSSSNTFGVFFKPIAEQFGWNRGTVSVAIAIRWIVVAFLVLPMGHLSDRYGPRRVVLPSFLLYGIGFLMLSRVTSVWQFYVVQGLVMGVANAGPFVCVISTVAKWHTRRRGMALGIASAGSGLSVVLLPPLTASLIAFRDWAYACVVLGLVTLVITIPASWFMKDPPTAGKPAAFVPGGESENKGQGKNRGPFYVMGSLPRLLKDGRFLSLFLFFFLFYVGAQLMSVHLVNYVTDAGVRTLVAATMMSVVGIASIVGRLAMGPLSDKIGTKADAALCCSFVIASLVLLTLKSEPLMWLAAVFYGMGSGGTAPLISAITGEHFGTENLATMTGAILIGANLGGALGPWMGGYLFDVTRSYLLPLLLSAVLTAAGLVIVLRLRSPRAEVS